MRAVMVSLALGLFFACSGPEPPRVDHPDLQTWEPAIRARLESVREDLDSAKDSESGVALASAYGEMGRHYQSVRLEEAAGQSYAAAMVLGIVIFITWMTLAGGN